MLLRPNCFSPKVVQFWFLFDSEDDAVQAVNSINDIQFEGNKISCIMQQNNSNKKSIQNVPIFPKFSKQYNNYSLVSHPIKVKAVSHKM